MNAQKSFGNSCAKDATFDFHICEEPDGVAAGGYAIECIRSLARDGSFLLH